MTLWLIAGILAGVFLGIILWDMFFEPRVDSDGHEHKRNRTTKTVLLIVLILLIIFCWGMSNISAVETKVAQYNTVQTIYKDSLNEAGISNEEKASMRNFANAENLRVAQLKTENRKWWNFYLPSGLKESIEKMEYIK